METWRIFSWYQTQQTNYLITYGQACGYIRYVKKHCFDHCSLQRRLFSVFAHLHAIKTAAENAKLVTIRRAFRIQGCDFVPRLEVNGDGGNSSSSTGTTSWMRGKRAHVDACSTPSSNTIEASVINCQQHGEGCASGDHCSSWEAKSVKSEDIRSSLLTRENVF